MRVESCFRTLAFGFYLAACSELGLARSGADLQAILDRGEDVSLEPREMVELTATLKFTHEGQSIRTTGGRSIADFAVLRHGESEVGMLIEGNGIAGVQLRDLVLDANRPAFRTDDGVVPSEPMISLGGEGGFEQSIRRCVVLNSRSSGGWGAIHIQEGGRDIVVEDNIIFASGSDIRGNGRSPWEKPFGWGDGISTASRGTLVRNNIIYDVSDDGIMVQGGPGTSVLGNVVVSVSREMFGGIVLIDPFEYFRIDTASGKRYDYRDVLVEGNWIVAMGGRMHSGIPMGGAPWHPGYDGTVLWGATVRDNLISGKAAGYGYVVNGVDGFTVVNNRSDAVYSGVGDGLHHDPPDEPSAFLFDASAIGDSDLQPEFKAAKRHLKKVLRSDRVPSGPMGYRDVGYPNSEAEGIVETAFLEMLGRSPFADEAAHWFAWLRSTHANADALRRQLMGTPEFAARFGLVDPIGMHQWRSDRWLELIISTFDGLQRDVDESWPIAKEFHLQLVRNLTLEGVSSK